MNFKDITVQLLDSFLSQPTANEFIISRKLCINLFDIMKLLTWFYGPSMKYETLKEIFEAR